MRRALLLGLSLVGMVSCGPGEGSGMYDPETGEYLGELQSCSNTSAQPAGCYYGQFCGVNAFCEPVPAPTCQNFVAHGTRWNPSTSLGPILYQSGQIYFGPDTTWCLADFDRVVLRLRAWSPSGNLPTSRSGFSSWFYYVRTDGTRIDGSQLINNINTSLDRRNTTFDVNFCVPRGSPGFSAGFYFVDGNEYCTTAQR